MPVRRGHIAPKNTYIDTLIKKFDNQSVPDAAFIIANSKIASNPIIYCSADFCDLFSFTKAQLLLKSSSLSFLYGENTTSESIQALSDGLVCDREVKILLSLYTRKDEVRQCELTVTPLTDELGRIALHIIFFEAVEQVQPDKKPSRRVSSRRLSNIATMIFHRNGKEVPRSNLHRTHHLSQSVRNEVLPKQVVLSRRPSENIPTENNNRVSISSLFLNGPKSSPEAVDPKKGCRPNPESLQLCTRFDSTSMDTGNSVTLRSSAPTSHVSVGNEPPVKRSEIRPKSCTNAPLWPVLQSSETESTTDRVRPASAVLGARCSRYVFPSLLTRGSRLLSAPVSQTSLVLSDAGTLQLVLGKHGDQSKSHVTDTFAKILSLDKDLHEKRKLESKHMHKYTLKHYSPTRAVWDWFILILVIYTAIFTPYNAAFLLNHNVSACSNAQPRSAGQQTILGIADKLVDVMFFMDIIINFRTTYVNKNDEVVSQPKKIAFHYLKSWFIIDLVAAIPFDAVISKSYEKQQPTALTGLLKSARLLRLINVVRKLDRYSEYGTAILVLLTSIFVLIAHWLACICIVF
ncbi:unnamed protein product [Rodentolepis nana]|uniref:Ion_trans domain-containing protein n=1 Tax=Rodentolepis nana TaxID=102285 RepID=A0A0R3T3B5_RODNA|nr:unnamed protein product [Rodentolepis nana]